jgi:phosphoglycerol transferase MdoB-like AlkP superfamily enzyme
MLRALFIGVKLRGNIYAALVLSLLLVMVLYTISRIGFYLFNTAFFPDMDAGRFLVIMGGGLRFDLAATLYSNSLFILLMTLPIPFRYHNWYKAVLKWIFIICNTIAFAANSADIIYYRFTLRRTTLSVLNQFENETNLEKLFFRFLFDYWHALLFFIFLVVLLVLGYRKITFSGPQIKRPILFYSSGLVTMLLVVVLFVGGARGGFRESTRPITLSNAAAYAKEPMDINLVLNTPFALMRTAKANVIEKVNYFSSQQELNHYFNPLKKPIDSVVFQNKNVVVIILESFSKEFIGAYNKNLDQGNYKGYTPFLDSLIAVSNSFRYSMANGRKSIDAMPSVICSIPSIEVPYVLSHFSGNKINSLPNLLREKGYYSAFFHGAPNGSMGFDAFANQSGFDDYFGKDEYGNNDDFDGIWGIWDEKFLQYYAKKINSFKPPFYTTLFTVSSHHPYKLPKEYKNKFAGGSLPIYKTIEYTDLAIKRFFATASNMPWFKNTLFVITADHASAEIKYPEYNTAWGYFAIPLIFYEPEKGVKEMKDEIVQQVDILPSILGSIGYDKPYIAFGRNVFDKKEEPFAFNYLNNIYQSFRGNYLLQFDGVKSIGLYDFKSDQFLKTNLVKTLPDTVQKLELRLKAFIQHYNNRMVDNDLTREGSQLKVLGRQK